MREARRPRPPARVCAAGILFFSEIKTSVLLRRVGVGSSPKLPAPTDHGPYRGTGAVSPECPSCGSRARPSPAPIRPRDAPPLLKLPPPQNPKLWRRRAPRSSAPRGTSRGPHEGLTGSRVRPPPGDFRAGGGAHMPSSETLNFHPVEEWRPTKVFCWGGCQRRSGSTRSASTSTTSPRPRPAPNFRAGGGAHIHLRKHSTRGKRVEAHKTQPNKKVSGAVASGDRPQPGDADEGPGPGVPPHDGLTGSRVRPSRQFSGRWRRSHAIFGNTQPVEGWRPTKPILLSCKGLECSGEGEQRGRVRRASGGGGAEGTASGVPQEAFQPGDLDFP